MPLEVYTSDPPAVFPQSKFDSAEFNSSILAALASSDESTAKQHFDEAFRIMNEQCGEVIPAWGNKVFVKKTAVKNLSLGYYDIAQLGEVYIA
jgi:hypothetical protein